MPTKQPNRQLQLLAVGGALVVALGIMAMLGVGRPIGQPMTTPAPTIFAGEPGGAVIPAAEPTPTATVAQTPTVTPVLRPSHAPPPATQIATPAPTTPMVALAQPDDAVAAWYRYVAEGDFDAAYSLWSDRMKATYPREENLDQRFSETASITFHQLSVAEQRGSRATVQANFTETYDSGATRDFIGYWRLVRVEGRWLLDEPHY